MNDLSKSQPRNTTRRWAYLRLSLGALQMTGATAAAFLLLTKGASKTALLLVVLTCAFTTVSVLLFGGRRDRQPSRDKHGGQPK